MSTITIVKKNGIAAIACDTLTKFGSSKESASYVVNHSKILSIDDNFLAVSGPTSGKLVLQSYFAGEGANPDLTSVAAIFDTWKKLHQSLKDDYFLRPDQDEDDSFESTRMNVVIANKHGIFAVGAHRSVQEFSRFYASGRGAEYALGAMYVAYNDPTKSAEEVAVLGVEAAAEFNDSTGTPARVHTIKLAAP